MVGLVDDYFKQFPVNSRIRVHDDYGTVRFVGEVKGYPGQWVGVEWDDPSRGKHDGLTGGTRYFQTEHPTAGSMIRPGKIQSFETLEGAVKDRYLIKDQNPLDENLMREAQQYLHASVFEIVGMEKIAKKQSQIEELTDISVAYSCTNSAGDLSSFRSLRSINLTSTLIWNWRTVADIAKQIPTLTEINMGSNLLELPSEKEIFELEPSFQHIKHINLRKCGLRKWEDVVFIARLWPNIESLSLPENEIENITLFDCKDIFKNLRELDLHSNKLSSSEEICKLGSIGTLNALLLMENGIEQLQLPPCDFDTRLSIFPSLEILNLFHNPLSDESAIFNELDKLPALHNLCKTFNEKTGYEEMVSKAVALVPQLKVLNKVVISPEQRRGAEYDIWKQYGHEWQQTENDPEERTKFCMKYRAYPRLVEKYGSPAEFLVRPPVKVSNLIKIKIQNKLTGETFEKKVPRKMSVQALQGLIIKHFKLEETMPHLSYRDANHPTLVVEMDNTSKNLDYYSIQEGDSVIVEWSK